MKGKPSLLNRSALLALVALLGLTVAVGTGSAGASSGSDVTVAAKKKCKKGKKSAVAAKRKCKKRTTTPAPAPTPPAPSPTVRATLTWNSTADLDLVVWDSGGTVAYVDSNPNPIGNSHFSADDLDGNGPESFTDNAFVPSGSNRQFSYGACVASDGSPTTQATINYKRADGTTGSFTSPAGRLDDDGHLYYVHVAGGFDPVTQPNPC